MQSLAAYKSPSLDVGGMLVLINPIVLLDSLFLNFLTPLSQTNRFAS